MSSSMIVLMLIAGAGLGLASIRRIPEGKVYSMRRPGGHVRMLGAGTHFVMPLIERVSHKISLTGTALPIEGASHAGEPLQGSVFFQVLEPERADVVIESVDGLLREHAATLMRSPALPVETAERRQWLKQQLNAEVRDSGLLVTRIELRKAA